MPSPRRATVRACPRLTILTLTLAVAGLGGIRSVAAEDPAATATATPAPTPDDGRVVFARDLALSPDGQTLAFSWGGDIWSVPVTGGQARRLTVHPADDRYPVWSHAGDRLAFASERHGAANIYLMAPDGTAVQRLTYADRAEIPTDFAPDDRTVYFQAMREGDVYREARLYRVPVAGGQPWRLLDCFGAAARISPDGTTLAFTRGGLPWVRWSRRNYRGSGNIDVYTVDLTTQAFRQITKFDGTDRAPAWSGDGTALYFLSDRAGPVNIWRQTLADAQATQVTQMTTDDVREFSVAANGSALAFTHWDAIYVMPLPGGPARLITVTAATDQPDNDLELETLRGSADEQEPSPDGKEIALVVRGEIYVIKTKDDFPTRRVTQGPARDRDIAWSPDGKALFFVSDSGGVEHVYRATSGETPAKPLSDSLRFTIEQVTAGDSLEYGPQISPDGKQLAFVRARGDLIIRDLKSGDEHTLLPSWNRPSFQWSPDSKWIAYEIEDLEHNADIWIIPADGSAPAVNISQHPDNDDSPQWSADGQMLAFTSRREGFDADLYVVFLSPEIEQMAGFERAAYFEDASGALKKRKPPKSAVASGKIALAHAVPATQTAASQPTSTQTAETPSEAAATADFRGVRSLGRDLVQWLLAEPESEKPDAQAAADDDDEKKDGDEKKDEADKKKTYAYDLPTAYERLRRVTSLPGDQSGFAFAPDGQLLAFVSSHEGSSNVYTIKWDGSGQKRIISTGVGALRWGADGKRLFYLRGGVPYSINANGSDSESHNFAARLAISRPAEAQQKFEDGARQLGLRFYHPTMKGLDWPGLTKKYEGLALQTHTQTEFNEIFNMLLGELNASHLGIYGPRRGGGDSVGYLGVALDRNYPGPGLKITGILPDSPADRAESRLHVGDILLTVNDLAVGPDLSLDHALVGTVGNEIIVTYQPAPDPNAATTQPASAPAAGDEPANLVIRPISYGAFDDLKYEDWVRQNRAYVDQQSNGRVGYLHIRAMGEASFDRFERDLYSAAHGRDGLIVDVRSNGGGWTADWVMAVLSVKRHAFTVPRGGVPGYPQDRLIFYSWTKPATMMCNQQSFSNAEIVSHAFKSLARGPLVGMQTFGGVISTGGYTLIDGALVRMPTRGWFTLPSGNDMELHGAVPDVQVPITPEDEIAGRRPQLQAAVEATLAQLEPAATPAAATQP